MSNENCAFCSHPFTPECNVVTYMQKGARIRLCKVQSMDDLHPEDCYKRFRDLNK